MNNENRNAGQGETPDGRDTGEAAQHAHCPPKSSDCPLTAHLVQYALRKVSGASTDTAIGRHVDECPSCAKRVKSFKAAAGNMSITELALVDPQVTWVGETEQLPERETRSRRWAGYPLIVPTVLASSLLCFFIGLSVRSGREETPIPGGGASQGICKGETEPMAAAKLQSCGDLPSALVFCASRIQEHMGTPGRGGPLILVVPDEGGVATGDDVRGNRIHKVFNMDAAHRFAQGLSRCSRIVDDDKIRATVLEHVADPGRPLPEGLLTDEPAYVSLVHVRRSDPDFRMGDLSVRLVDLREGTDVETVDVPFRYQAEPLPLFDVFSGVEVGDDRVRVSKSAYDSDDIVSVEFENLAGMPRAVFTSRSGVPISAVVPGRAVELCFEARADTVEGQPAISVQFSSGGKEVLTTDAAPVELGGKWRRFRIPVDLGDAELWSNGLAIQIRTPNGRKAATVQLRNAWVRCRGLDDDPRIQQVF